MPTWNDYKRHVQEVNPEAAKDMKEAEEYAAIISDMMRRGGFVPASDDKHRERIVKESAE